MLRFWFVCVPALAVMSGCSVAPREMDWPAFRQRVDATTRWFEFSVDGLREQIDASGGYVVFPGLIQWGMLFTGGTYGRGAVCRPDGSQVGWAVISTGSIGLQAGVQEFRMLAVFEDRAVMEKFQRDQLLGSANGVAIAMEEGASARIAFHDGVALYESANEGLMAGVNLGLNLIRYEPLSPSDRPPLARR